MVISKKRDYYKKKPRRRTEFPKPKWINVNASPAIAHREAVFALAWPSVVPERSRVRADRIPEAMVTALRDVIPMKPGLKSL